MGKSEAYVETYLVKQTKRLGGKALSLMIGVDDIARFLCLKSPIAAGIQTDRRSRTP